MKVLGIDVGSSSVKAGILSLPLPLAVSRSDASDSANPPADPPGEIIGEVARAAFPTRFEGIRAEVDAHAVLHAVAAAIAQLGDAAQHVDHIALSVMSPSWLAMDRAGEPLTPVVTHQDRRSVEIAAQLEHRVGKARHLELAGNRPFPGGISSTTYAWYAQHEPERLRDADLVGHLSTFLHRHLTGARVTDPSNASFMGLYSTLDQRGWSDELCEAVGVPKHLLPEVRDADRIGGKITGTAATRFGLQEGTPVLVGLMDTSAAMLLAGAKAGRLVNVCGSTDVLILCTDHPRPDEKLLTRALGVGPLWTSVSTLAAAGSAFEWAKRQLFADLSRESFYELMSELAASHSQYSVRFEPYLAGERTSIIQRQGAFTGLTLSTTREQMLGAMIESLAKASAARLSRLKRNAGRIARRVLVSGGVSDGLDKVLHRDWPGKWEFVNEGEATLRGLAALEPKE